jgi:hypothetical protein
MPSEQDADAIFAKMIALAARNGVEDLHTDGAFSDQQAPALNRRVRGRIYEVLIAVRRGDLSRDDDLFTDYLWKLAGDRPGDVARAAVQGAIAKAVDEFAEVEAINSDVASQLRQAAIKEALFAFEALLKLHRGDPEARKDVAYWLWLVPDYWEEPAVSPEFQAVLDSARPTSDETARR